MGSRSKCQENLDQEYQQERRKEDRVFILPNQMREEDNKALGVGYLVEEDKLYVMTSINLSRRRKKMRVGQDLLVEEVREKSPTKLSSCSMTQSA